MAKFESIMSDLVVSTDSGFIQFKDGVYVTTNKDEISALKKCKDVSESGKTTPKTQPKLEEPID